MSSARSRGSVLDVIADRLLGAVAGNVMGVVSIVSLLASISAMTFAGPRVYFAMARDGLFFRAQPPAFIRDTRLPRLRLSRRRCGALCWYCRRRRTPC